MMKRFGFWWSRSGPRLDEAFWLLIVFFSFVIALCLWHFLCHLQCFGFRFAVFGWKQKYLFLFRVGIQC